MKFEKGFSLVELLIAVFLLTVGLLAAAGMQTTAINSNAWANKFSTATALAEEVMEDLLARDSTDAIFDDTTSATFTYDLNVPDATSNNIDIPGAGTFTATYTITPNTPATNVTTISVTVQTTGRSVTFTSYKRAI